MRRYKIGDDVIETEVHPMLKSREAIHRHEFQHGLLLHGDAVEGLKTLPSDSVHVALTSPPYFALRSYALSEAERPHEIGREPSWEAWIDSLVEVFREVRRVLRPDGVLLVNCGDKYAHDSKWGGRSGGKNGDRTTQDRDKQSSGFAAGNAMGLPYRLAIAIQADGWVWRDTVVWGKLSPMPVPQPGTRWERCRVKVERGVDVRDEHSGQKPHGKDIRDRDGATKWTPCPGCDKCRDNAGWVLRPHAWRFTPSWEPVFMFARSMRYFSDSRACAEPVSGGAHHRGSQPSPPKDDGRPGYDGFSVATAAMRDTRNPRNVLTAKQRRSLKRENRELRERVKYLERELIGDVLSDRESNPESVINVSHGGGTKEKHYAAFPQSLVRKLLTPFVSPGGCCSICGAQYAPAIETETVATRPGTATKQQKGDTAKGCLPGRDDSNTIGNRDPQRKVQRVKVLDYRPTCECRFRPSEYTVGGVVAVPTARSVPATVLDPFMGTGTVAAVAEKLGANWIGCELSSEYCAIISRRMKTLNKQGSLFR